MTKHNNNTPAGAVPVGASQRSIERSIERLDALLAGAAPQQFRDKPKRNKRNKRPKRAQAPSPSLPRPEARHFQTITARIDTYTCPACGSTAQGDITLGVTWHSAAPHSSKCGWERIDDEDFALLTARGLPLAADHTEHRRLCWHCIVEQYKEIQTMP